MDRPTVNANRRRGSPMKSGDSPLLRLNLLSLLIWIIGVTAVVVLSGLPMPRAIPPVVGAVFLFAGLSPRRGGCEGFTLRDVALALRELADLESTTEHEENNHG